ncbi:helix-turn-helix domain-containing protein [Morganella morganii]|uniref:helix-turn-helix domain-containing protein n=1 Tax=Morganella morganii TaxID=582 RepID=UPI00046AA345|nr:helix-turn-helix transcriptional regulator [Morganella morganii]
MSRTEFPYDSLLYKNAGVLIKELRTGRGMSGEILGGLVGISQQQISRYERGETRLTLDQVSKIAGALNISIWEFMKMLEVFFYDNKNTTNYTGIKWHYCNV